MTFSKSENIDRTKYKLVRNEIEHVREYKYLGFIFILNESVTNGINRLTKQWGKAWFAVQKYVRCFKQKNIRLAETF